MPASTFPTFATSCVRDGGVSRRYLKTLPLPGSDGVSFQVTLMLSIAWIAPHSVSDTTPTRSPFVYVPTRSVGFRAKPSTFTRWAPMLGGITMRACSIPGTRMLWTRGQVAVTFFGIVTDGIDWPITLYLAGSLTWAWTWRSSVDPEPSTLTEVLKLLLPISSP